MSSEVVDVARRAIDALHATQPPGSYEIERMERATRDLMDYTTALEQRYHVDLEQRDAVFKRHKDTLMMVQRLLDMTHKRLERLEDDNAAMIKIMQQIVDGPEDASMYLCNYCDEYINGIVSPGVHKPECPVSRMSALLAERER